MCSQINNMTTSVFHKHPSKPSCQTSFLLQPKPRTQLMITISCCYNQEKAITSPTAETCNIKFKTGKACKLGISIYPNFVYNADGGNGTGTAIRTNNSLPNEFEVSFDLQTLYIPSLTSATTTFLGLPLPPFLRIDIAPEIFQGNINQATGKVDLEFKAKFMFSVGNIYKAPALVVKTILTTEESNGKMKSGKGKRLGKEGQSRLVGVATIDPIDDVFLNFFLGLPTECLADLNATISFASS